MYWKGFYYKNALKRVLLQECIGKTLYINVLERVLLQECIKKGFTVGIHWKDFYCMNV